MPCPRPTLITTRDDAHGQTLALYRIGPRYGVAYLWWYHVLDPLPWARYATEAEALARLEWEVAVSRRRQGGVYRPHTTHMDLE